MINIAFIKKNILWFHILFWIGYFALVTSNLSNFYPLEYAFIRAFINGLFFIALAYLNMLYLIPRWLEKERFWEYALLIVILTMIFIWVRLQVTDPQPAPLLQTQAIGEIRSVLVAIGFIYVFLISTSYKLAEGWFENLSHQTNMKNQQLEAELKFLRMQINPHFLFNTLNNIYTLCLLKEDNAPTMVMKLSHLMRYMLYESHEHKVLLSKEVAFLKDYVELQQLKTERTQQIHFKIEGSFNQYKIIPLLLLPLLENSFKHGDVDTNEEGWVSMHLHMEESGQLHFRVANSIGLSPKQKPEASGIGLENTQRRLALLYPGRHTFQVKAETHQFTVELSIKL